MKDGKYIVVHNGSRDSYQIAQALYEHELLECLITDIYAPLDHVWFNRIVASLSPKLLKILSKRYSPALPSKVVKAQVSRALLNHIIFKHSYDHIDDYLGIIAGKLAKKNTCGLISYNYYAYTAYKAYGKSIGSKFYIACTAHPAIVRTSLLKEVQRVPEIADSLYAEPEFNIDDQRFQRLCNEPCLAHHCIVPSTYVKKTLVEYGINSSQISVIPYGVDVELFKPGNRPTDGPLRVGYVGRICARKGAYLLLDAWQKLEPKNAELTLVGSVEVNMLPFLQKAGNNVQIMGHVSRIDLPDIYNMFDVMILPSLSEGFGLVILEALACGTPVIASAYSGGMDVIVNGENGFITSIENEDIIEKIKWCINNQSLLKEMRKNARLSAEYFTWSRFRSKIVDTVTSL